MKEIATTLSTTAIFSDNGERRYALTKVWDKKKPKLAIIMLAPSEASGVSLDNTTMLVLNNASRLGYGSVSIVNLFSKIGRLEMSKEPEDEENLKWIDSIAKEADTIVYASGVGKATNKAFIARQNKVLEVLKPYEVKLHCITNKQGNARFQHPLSPAIRIWHLSSMKINELCKAASTVVKANASSEKKKKQKSLSPS